jgi:hypothetical protein
MRSVSGDFSMGAPSINILPVYDVSMPARILRSVLLPHPDGPTMVTNPLL